VKSTPGETIAIGHPQVPRLETPRLWLRPWSTGDVQEYARIVPDPEVMRYMGSGLCYAAKRAAASVVASVSDVESWWRIRRLARHWQRCTFGEWAVEEKATGQLIGQIGLTHHPNWIADPAKVEVL
jgi:RimJ/RimL family protein N-acetyltransferase